MRIYLHSYLIPETNRMYVEQIRFGDINMFYESNNEEERASRKGYLWIRL